MSGIADVARAAGVSKSTASRALTGSGYVSDATRVRVQAAAASLGYVASTNAVSLATGRSRAVGVLMPDVTRWFFSEVLEGVQAALLSEGLDLTLYTSAPGTAERDLVFGEFLARRRFDGLIAIGLDPTDGELARLRALSRPVVSVASGGATGADIAIDDEHAVRRATEHLIELGHRRVVFLGGLGEYWWHIDEQRYRGYRETMAAAGLAELTRQVMCEISLPGGYDAAADLLSDPDQRPTAIVAVCDEVAIGALIAARRLGIGVPGELSVVGVDDHEYAEMFSLTTLAQRPREQGMAAVELLSRRMVDADAAPTAPLHARLVVRHSTASPRAAM